MNPLRDPERLEIKVLQEIGDLAESQVIEIGCGDGRLTWQYAGATMQVTGIDMDAQRLSAAFLTRPSGLSSKTSFLQAKSETMPLKDNSFDVALFAWSF